MKVFISNIWWGESGQDITGLPDDAVVELNLEELNDEEDLFESVKDCLEEKHSLRPNGFCYEFLGDCQ